MAIALSDKESSIIFSTNPLELLLGRVDEVYIADITDVDSELWDSFGIEVVPTMAVFENGVLVKRWDGQLQKGLTIDQIESVNHFLDNS